VGESVSGEQSGAARWLSVHDELLRGLTHALSNRIGTISATAYLLEMQPAALGATASRLRDEGERLETLLHLFRLLPRRAQTAAEPIVPSDVMTQAIDLQAYHPTLGDVPVTVVHEGDLQPAYADPATLVVALTLVIGAAQRAARADGRVTVTISSTTDVVAFTAHGRRVDGTSGVADADTAHDVQAVRWLLAPYGGDGMGAESGASVVVPTLQAARRAPRQ
jgi:signal transduction histidine kinase